MGGVVSSIGNAVGGLFGGGGGSQQTGMQTVTSQNQIDPALRPYVDFGLQEAKRLYQSPTPYAPFQTYIDPSSQTLSALSGIERRAMAGSPLLGQAQSELGRTISGDYLSGNPFFQGAFQAAARPIEQQFGQNIMDIRSKASSAGRYGSGAQTNLENRAATGLSTALADIGGKLAYQNYGDERTRQANAILAAPEMAAADYTDPSKLLAAGLAREGYSQAQIADQLARYQYQMPESRLSTFLTGVYGAPSGSVSTQQRPIYENPSQQGLGNLLSLVGTAGSLGWKPFSDIRTKENIKQVGSMANGLGVYEYEYKKEFKDHPSAGHGKFIGVMAHEVEKVIPEAVSVDSDGYKHIDYSLIN
jgi:hypothetical protein